jgi:hypothetical protein
MNVTINANKVTVIDKVRKCGACGDKTHDRRNCPTVPKVTKDSVKDDTEKLANHLRFLTREEHGSCRLTDPASFWAKLGPDSGTYPFLRDFKGAIHMPGTAKSGGGHKTHDELMKMPEYTWDAERRLFIRNGPCPGCV